MRKKYGFKIFTILCMFTAALIIGCGQKQNAQSKETSETVKESMAESGEEMMESGQEETKSEESSEEGKSGEMGKNEGDPAPELILTDFDGNEYKLSEQKGKKVYVKFWASWCGACLSSLPELNEMAAEDQNFEIITVVTPGLGGEQDKEEFIEWFKGLGYDNIKVYFDESGQSMAEYGVRALPTAAFIGTDGVLVGTQVGVVPAKDIIRSFDELVK